MSSAPGQPGRQCQYPQSHPTARPIRDELAAVAQNKDLCSSIYLDTVQSQSSGGENHHQGLARSHKLSDGSVWFFLTHSDVDDGGQGSLSAYRFGGPTQGEHVLTTRPDLTVAPRQQIIMLNERHPSDLVFLPDVNHPDAGYVFITQEYDRHVVTCYRWDPLAGLVLHGDIPQWLPPQGPMFVFLGRSLCPVGGMSGWAGGLSAWAVETRVELILNAQSAGISAGCGVGLLQADPAVQVLVFRGGAAGETGKVF